MRIDPIDLVSLDGFAAGFPHPVFAVLRREARSGGTRLILGRPAAGASG